MSINDNTLTPDEKAAMERHEQTILRAEQAQLDKGRALAAIRDGRLYREDFESFDAYCKEKWALDKRYAYYLIDGAATYDLLAARGVTELPLSESHVRAITALDDDAQVAVWAAIVEACGGASAVTKEAAARIAAEIRDGERAAQTEDGTEAPAELAPELARGAAREPTTLIEDIGVIGGEPPEVVRDGGERLLVAVPRTLYTGAPVDAPNVIVDAAVLQEELDRRMDRELIAMMMDEAELLGYTPKFNRTNESVDWAWWTWNPLTGCYHDCEFCYARELARRFYPQGFTPTFYPGRLLAPKNTPLPEDEHPAARHVFVCSQGDLGLGTVPRVVFEAVLAEVEANPAWTFLFLTKNPKRFAQFTWPANAWVGASVVSQEWVRPMEEAFARVNAAVRWVSFEPLLGPVVLSRPELVDLYVIGSQTRTSAVPAFQPQAEWVEALRAQARSVGATVFEKENLRALLKQFPVPDPSRLLVEPRENARPQPALRAAVPLERRGVTRAPRAETEEKAAPGHEAS